MKEEQHTAETKRSQRNWVTDDIRGKKKTQACPVDDRQSTF